jgi:hypothetical protein
LNKFDDYYNHHSLSSYIYNLHVNNHTHESIKSRKKITFKIKSPAKTDHHRFEDAVVRLILIELTTSTLFNPVLDRKKAQIYESLGLDNREARTWVKNKRYKLKVERDTNYPKFQAACAAAQVPCPDNNNWLQGLKPEEFDLDDLPQEIEQEPESMAPSASKMSSPLPSSRMLVLANSPHHQYENSKFYLLLKLYFVCNFSIIHHISSISDYSATPATNSRRQQGFDSFQIDFQTIHQAHPGFGCSYVMQFPDPGGSMVYDYFEIMRFPPDGRDVLILVGHEPTVSAKLLEDGTGMVVTEPLLPSYLWQNLSEMHHMDPFPKEKKIDFLSKVKSYKELPEQQRHTTIYFPDGIVGTTDYIGADPESTDPRTDLQLFSNLFHCPVNSVTDDEDGEVLCYYGYWKIGVKGTTKKANWHRDIDVDSTASKMNRLKIAKKKGNESKQKDGDEFMN